MNSLSLTYLESIRGSEEQTSTLSAIRKKQRKLNRPFILLKSHFFKENMMGGGAFSVAITMKDIDRANRLEQSDQITESLMDQVRLMDPQTANLQPTFEGFYQTCDVAFPRLINGEVAV